MIREKRVVRTSSNYSLYIRSMNKPSTNETTNLRRMGVGVFVHSCPIRGWHLRGLYFFIALSRPIRWTGFMSLLGNTRRYSNLLRPKLNNSAIGAPVAFK
mgnify:CR=1 FL=1